MKPVKISIIEDDLPACALLREELAEVFPDIETFETVPDFFKAYNFPEPRVVITDYKMRHGTGTQFISRAVNEHLPFVIVGNSASNSLSQAIDFLTMGAEYYFVKPVETHKLIDMMPELMRKAAEKGRIAQMEHEIKDKVGSLTNEQRHIARLMLDFDDISKAVAMTGKAAETVRSHWKSASGKLNLERIEERYIAFRLLAEQEAKL